MVEGIAAFTCDQVYLDAGETKLERLGAWACRQRCSNPQNIASLTCPFSFCIQASACHDRSRVPDRTRCSSTQQTSPLSSIREF